MTAQIIFFVAALAIVLTWFGLSIREGPDFSKVPNLGDTLLYAPGTVMLNLAMASIIPSWVNLKKPSVDIKMSLVVSILVSVLLYTLGGYFRECRVIFLVFKIR